MLGHVETHPVSNDASPRSPLPHGDCAACPLRGHPAFAPVGPDELALIQSLKRHEAVHPAGTALLHEGEADGPLYTLLSGWAFRYKTLADGRRQILDVLLPGDFIGLQQRMGEANTHGVETLTDVRVCRFARDALWRVHREQPMLGYDLTWLAAHQDGLVSDNLLSVGRRTASERLAALLLALHERARPFEPPDEDGILFPLTRQHLADALGLSRVHLHRALRGLRQRDLLRWPSPQRLQLPDPAALAREANLRWPLPLARRPLI